MAECLARRIRLAAVAVGAGEDGAYSAGGLRVDQRSEAGPPALQPVSLGGSTSPITAAFSSGDNSARGVRAVIDASLRLFRALPPAPDGTMDFNNVVLTAGFVPISLAAGFNGETYVVARSPTGASFVIE